MKTFFYLGLSLFFLGLSIFFGVHADYHHEIIKLLKSTNTTVPQNEKLLYLSFIILSISAIILAISSFMYSLFWRDENNTIDDPILKSNYNNDELSKLNQEKIIYKIKTTANSASINYKIILNYIEDLKEIEWKYKENDIAKKFTIIINPNPIEAKGTITIIYLKPDTTYKDTYLIFRFNNSSAKNLLYKIDSFTTKSFDFAPQETTGND